MSRCECGHGEHMGFFGDCLLCDCRRYHEAPRFWYLRRLWRWLKAVPR